MAAALSQDLRACVTAAIEAGASCRQAAARFGVGETNAIHRHACYRMEGTTVANPMGRDRHSHRTKAYAALILQTLEERSHAYLRKDGRPCRTTAPW